MLIRTPGACALPLKVSRNTVGHDDFSTVDLPMERHVPAGKTVVTKQFMTKPILICAPRVKSRVISDRHISTHVPRAESDARSTRSPATSTHSIHAPARGATSAVSPAVLSIRHFNPRSPCGERQQTCHRQYETGHFNPRSPCGERQATRV